MTPLLSVLDQSPIVEGSTGADALRQTLELAELADALGYHRYWVSEHHGGLSLAGPAPEVLIPAIASRTSAALRVGSGGVMLPHYSPLKVAEQFSLLAGLFPGRIDLGIGRASGTDPLTQFALQRDRRTPLAHDDFRPMLAELLGHLRGTLPPDHAFARLAQTLPGLPHAPEPWLLGSSQQSAIWAAELGLPYAFADFINPGGAPLAALYASQFTPGVQDAAQVAVAAWVLVADTEEEAVRRSWPHRVAMRALRTGRPIPFPSPERAERMLRAEGIDPWARDPNDRRRIVGTPDAVADGVERLARDYGASEVIAVTITHDHVDRLRSYELLAGALRLAPRGATALRA